MPFLTTQGIRILQVLVAFTLVLALFITVGRFGSHRLGEGSLSQHVKLPESFKKAPSISFGGRTPPEPKPANATLDFQEIIYLSMPYRTDRQDALSLIAAVSGLKLTMIPGVAGDSMHPKGMPGHVGNNNMTGTPALGIWRAHANVWRHMIDNDIQSALILEDDVDWDVNIKEIMGLFSWQLRYNNTIRWGKDVQKGWEEDCPYGCDWDELFVGQCGGHPNPDRMDLHFTYADPDGPNLTSIQPFWQKEIKNKWNLTEAEASDGLRVISPTFQPICLMGYGLTRMGAMRMLYQIGGWRPFGHPVDNEIAWRTAAGVMSGYTMVPPAIVAWRLGGAQDSDNDKGITSKPMNKEGVSKGHSIGLKNSVRRSLAKFFEKNYWKDMEKQRPL